MESVSAFGLIAGYHAHIQTTLKYLQIAQSGISSNIDLVVLYCKSHSIQIIVNIHSPFY